MKRLIAGIVALAASGASQATAQPAPAYTPPDYAPASAWLCRPDNNALCTTGLDAVAVAADGTRTPLPFVPAADPKVDCFYVYPTVSAEPTPLADMTPGDAERHVVVAQAARLSSRCRVFAPVYRQVTLAGLRATFAGGAALSWDAPYRDVRAAWNWYLANANQGRGVIIVGHSQGTIVLQQLIANDIDGKPVAKRLVAAFLAGDPALPVPAGATVGGVFKSIPLCTAAAQTGCVYVWSSYRAADATANRRFGHIPSGGGLVAACASPAAPAGGAGELKAFLPRPAMAPASDPPWVAVRGQLTGECTADDQGSVLRVSVGPGRYADLLSALLGHDTLPGWGLHQYDLNLEQGNVLDAIDAEVAGWKG